MSDPIYAQALEPGLEQLRSDKKRLIGVIDTAMDGIVTIDSEFKIILANPAAAQTFGYQVEQLLGATLDLIIPMRHRHAHSAHVKEFAQTGVSKRRMGGNFKDYYVTGLHALGHEFPIEASISSLNENGQSFYTVIFRDVSKRKASEEQMALYHTQLSQLSSALQNIREEERKHIARELHDDLGQLLAALRMDISLMQREQALSNKGTSTLASMDQLLLNAITTLRRIASDLRPRSLDEGGLYFALQTLSKDFMMRHQIACDLMADEADLILDDEKSTAIFRVVQESLTNVARHAKASRVEINLKRSVDSLSLTIQDNGRGIEEGAMQKLRSFGLVGMRERIKALHGDFEIQSKLGIGTGLYIQIPISV